MKNLARWKLEFLERADRIGRIEKEIIALEERMARQGVSVPRKYDGEAEERLVINGGERIGVIASRYNTLLGESQQIHLFEGLGRAVWMDIREIGRKVYDYCSSCV